MEFSYRLTCSLPREGAGWGHPLLHMYIRLWEWDLDIILVESVVDALEDNTVISIGRIYAYPDDNLENEGRVTKFLENDAHTLSLLMVHAVKL